MQSIWWRSKRSPSETNIDGSDGRAGSTVRVVRNEFFTLMFRYFRLLYRQEVISKQCILRYLSVSAVYFSLIHLRHFLFVFTDRKLVKPAHISLFPCFSCHLNDLENVVPFVILGAFYCLTNPILGSALLVFRFFAVARVLHTVCYLGCIPQPSRATMFGIGLTVNLYMAFKIIEKVSSIALESF